MSQETDGPPSVDPRHDTAPESQAFASMLCAMALDDPKEALVHQMQLRDLGWIVTDARWAGESAEDDMPPELIRIGILFLQAVEAEWSGDAGRREMWLSKMRAEGWVVSKVEGESR